MRTRAAIAASFLLLAAVSGVRAQQPSGETKDSNAPSAPGPQTAGSATTKEQKNADGTAAKPASAPFEHRFWDRENDWLFAAVSAGRALDYASTLNARRRAFNEILLTNSIVDNHPLFAGIEVSATAASIGVSYIFHRTGHHRLERWTSAIHAGVAFGGGIRNYCLQRSHPGS